MSGEGGTFVRAYHADDHDALVALWRAVFPDAPALNDPADDIARKLLVQPEAFLVAERDGDVVGTCMAGYDGHRGWVHLLAVARAHRRRGVGAALIERAAELLAAAGCPKLNLQVRAGSPEAVAFYASLGFAVEARVSMGKHLAPRA